jgi:hypothetical protein
MGLAFLAVTLRLFGLAVQGLEQATHNPSTLFSAAVTRHPHQCLQGFYEYIVCLNHHEYA